MNVFKKFFNANVEGGIFKRTVGNEKLHEIRNDNGWSREFCQSKKSELSLIQFLSIVTHTNMFGIILMGTYNHIDHILIDKKGIQM
jgi:hypothetical protein